MSDVTLKSTPDVVISLSLEEAAVLYKILDVIAWDGGSPVAEFAEDLAQQISDAAADEDVSLDTSDHSGSVVFDNVD
jgi:hypothetical protein